MKYEDFGIQVNTSKVSGEYQTICPSCSFDRKKKSDKCLSVNLDKETWFCHHCGYKGGLSKIKEIVYKVPEWKNKTELSDATVKYFETRKISQNTLQIARVTESVEWMPKAGKEILTINFNYFRNNELVNIKYRGKDKDFKLFKDGELVLYNLDNLKGYTSVYIVEGEPDALAFIECGFKNVVSVPNGAKITNNNLEYISNSWDCLNHIDNFIIAVDNDEAGRALRIDLANRLGFSKCSYIEFDGAKDANEYLIKEDINKFKKQVEGAKDFPIEGSFTVDEIYPQLEVLYNKGLDKGVSSGMPSLKLNFVKGYITTITGIPGHGKSDFLDMICLNLLRNHAWKGAYYSPENKPTELHLAKMICKMQGKSWDGDHRITPMEVATVAGYLNRNIWWVKPEKDFTLDSILDRVSSLRQKQGLDYFVIDAWNKLEHKYAGSETKYIGESLDKIAMFCETENLHCFLVVHPAKMPKEKDSDKYKVPTLYDCAGSANFYNKSDNGITIYRNFEDGNKTTDVYITKVKFAHWGQIGSSSYHYDSVSGRFYLTMFDKEENWL